jgi:hypothetical protein
LFSASPTLSTVCPVSTPPKVPPRAGGTFGKDELTQGTPKRLIKMRQRKTNFSAGEAIRMRITTSGSFYLLLFLFLFLISHYSPLIGLPPFGCSSPSFDTPSW